MHNCVPRVFWAAALAAALASDAGAAKQTVKIAYIGPLTGGVSANGIGGRNSADLAVRLRNADPKAKYRYELVSLDDECKPNIAVQAATKAKELKPEVIYFGGLTPIGVRIRSQMERLGIDAVFEGTSGIKSDSYIDGLGKLAEGSLSFIEGAPWEKLPGGLYFIGKYAQQKYDQGPEAYGPFAFTAAGLIMDVIEQVGPSRRKVIEELRKTRDKDSIVGKISFDDHGQNVVPLITKYVVQDGKWVVWEDSEYASGRRKLK